METIIEQIFRALALIGIIGIVMVLGWNEPLKYRFMSRAEIYALENPTPPPDPNADKNWMWDKKNQRTLERGAYNQTGSSTGVFLGR